MKNNQIQNETMLLTYESPRVDCTCWDEDVLMASTEIGGEYPEGWN